MLRYLNVRVPKYTSPLSALPKTQLPDWGYSSAGRAPALHAGGQRFDPA